MRRFALLCVALATVGIAVQSAPAADRPVERGIVQSLSPTHLTLRSLDGTDISVILDGRTRFRLNGGPATIRDLRPGQVAEAVLVRGTARIVRAFGLRKTVASGVISSLSSSTLVVSGPTGISVTVSLTPRTRVRLGAVPVRRGTLKLGQSVKVTRASDGTAELIVIRAGAR